jgi:hypothetical protein
MTMEQITKTFYVLLIAILIICLVFVINSVRFKGRASTLAQKQTLSFEELQSASTPEQRRALLQEFTAAEAVLQHSYQFPKTFFMVVGGLNLVLLIVAFRLMRRDEIDTGTAKKMQVDLIMTVVTFGVFVLSFLILRYRTAWSTGHIVLLILPIAMAIASVALFTSNKFYKLFYRKRKYDLTQRY